MRRLAHLRHKATRLRSVAWAASESLISPLMQLALTPVLLHQLGAQQFGIWALSLMIAGLGSLASLGAPTATMKKVAELGSSPFTPDVESHIRAALRVALMGTTVIGLIIIGLALLFDGKVDADGPPSRLYVALGLSLCVLIVQELDNVISSSLKGAERFDLVAKVDIRYRVIWMLAVAACGWFFQSVMFCILAGFLVNSVKLFNKISIAKRYYNINIDFSEKASRAALQEITSLGKWYWAQAFAAFVQYRRQMAHRCSVWSGCFGGVRHLPATGTSDAYSTSVGVPSVGALGQSKCGEWTYPGGGVSETCFAGRCRLFGDARVHRHRRGFDSFLVDQPRFCKPELSSCPCAFIVILYIGGQYTAVLHLGWCW